MASSANNDWDVIVKPDASSSQREKAALSNAETDGKAEATLLSLKVDPIFSFLEARGTQGGPGGPRGKPGKGYPGPPGGPLAFPWVPPGLPWVPLASKKEKMGSTFNERRVRFYASCH